MVQHALWLSQMATRQFAQPWQILRLVVQNTKYTQTQNLTDKLSETLSGKLSTACAAFHSSTFAIKPNCSKLLLPIIGHNLSLILKKKSMMTHCSGTIPILKGRFATMRNCQGGGKGIQGKRGTDFTVARHKPQMGTESDFSFGTVIC